MHGRGTGNGGEGWRGAVHRKFTARFPQAMGEFDFLEPCALSRDEVLRITAAAEAGFAIYRRIAALLQRTPRDALLQLGVPLRLADVVRLCNRGLSETCLGRFDLAHTAKADKILEFNSDSPAMLLATFPFNADICKAFALGDPNSRGAAFLSRTIRQAVAGSRSTDVKRASRPIRAVFAYDKRLPDDLMLARYLLGVARLPPEVEASCHTIQSLTATEDGVFDQDSSPVDFIWRMAPWDVFVSEFRVTGGSAAQTLHALIASETLRIANPPLAFLLQSKAVQALIWGLCEQKTFFSPRERRLVRKYMLPTYLDPIAGKRHVVKPVYGRMGDSVRLVDAAGTTTTENGTCSYDDQLQTFQRYTALPKARFETEGGGKTLSVVTSCFVIGGRACGVLMRAGEGITDSSWWILPVGVTDQTPPRPRSLRQAQRRKKPAHQTR